MAKPLKIGLALGGGAARALAHIGILDGLQQHGINIDVISGTSMGAIIGAMFAYHGDAAEVRQRFNRYLESDIFDKSGFNFFKSLEARGEGIMFDVTRMARRGLFNTLMITQTSMISTESAMQSYEYLLDDLQIEDYTVPFAAVALDLLSGQRVVLDRGPVLQAIAASCAMPGVLQPIEHNGHLLVDGGWAETVPIMAARQLGADIVIAVDVGGAPRDFQAPRNAIDVIARADTLVRCALADAQLQAADVILQPKNGIAHWADFSKADEAIILGVIEVEKRINEIRKVIKKKSGWF